MSDEIDVQIEFAIVRHRNREDAMRCLGGRLRSQPAQSFGYTKNMSVYGKGRFAQKKHQYAGNGFWADTVKLREILNALF